MNLELFQTLGITMSKIGELVAVAEIDEEYFTGIIVREGDTIFEVLWSDNIRTTYTDSAYDEAKRVSSLKQVKNDDWLYIIKS